MPAEALVLLLSNLHYFIRKGRKLKCIISKIACKQAIGLSSTKVLVFFPMVYGRFIFLIQGFFCFFWNFNSAIKTNNVHRDNSGKRLFKLNLINSKSVWYLCPAALLSLFQLHSQWFSYVVVLLTINSYHLWRGESVPFWSSTMIFTLSWDIKVTLSVECDIANFVTKRRQRELM